MNVTIDNFHDIRHLTMRVEAGQSLHISGKSGCGKSGIFEALLWCFYGSTRGVEPRSEPLACVSVNVRFDDGTTITRTKNKKTLRFAFGDEVTDGDIAQVKINDYFQCDREGWIATSYVIQEKMHFIFTLPALDRYNMLLRLSMHGEDAEKRIKKLNDKIKSTSAEYTEKTTTYQQQLADYETLCEKYGVGFECALSTEKTLVFKNQVEGFNSTLQDLTAELNLARTHQLHRQTYAKNHARLQKDYATVVSYSDAGLANLENQFKAQRKAKKLREEKTALEVQLEKETKTLNATKPRRLLEVPSEEQLQDIQHRERLYKDESAKAEELEVEYSKDVVDAEIRSIEASLIEQEQATLMALARTKSDRLQRCMQELPDEPAISQNQIVQKLAVLTSECTDLQSEQQTELQRSVEAARTQQGLELKKLKGQAEAERTRLQAQAQEKEATSKRQYEEAGGRLATRREELDDQFLTLERSREVHSCPHCSGSIRYVHDTIEKSEEKPFDEVKYEQVQLAIVTLEEEVEALHLKRGKDDKAQQAELQRLLAEHERVSDEKKAQLQESYSGKINLWERNLKKEFGDRIQAVQDEITSLHKAQELWVLRLALMEEIAALCADLEALPEPLGEQLKKLTPKELTAARARLVKLRALAFHEQPPVSYSEYQTVIAYKKCKARHLELTSKIALLQSSLQELKNLPEKEIAATAVSTYQNHLSSQKTLAAQLELTKSDLAAIPETRQVTDIEKEITKYQRLKAKCENRLSNSKKACALIQRYEDIEALHDVCTGLNMRMIEYDRFSALIKEEIVNFITELIVFTNNYLAEASKILFDAPISIELSTEKQFKSGSIRQEINLLIHYKGGQVYNYESGLSGGEKARINAMLTLAFARYNDSKVLIFDEVVSFLDDKKAQQLMDIVHDKDLGVPGRIILLASQNCSSGLVHETREYTSFL